jgi:hypothetical protein
MFADAMNDLDLPLIGMHRELSRVTAAVQKRRPLLLLGAPGSGKTKVLKEATRGDVRIPYIPYAPVLHDLLTTFAEALLEVRHRAFSSMLKGARDPHRWLTAQTSVHLKGLLWTAVEREPLIIVIDGVQGASARTYRFLQRIYHTPGVALIVAARDLRSLDVLGKLFWDPGLLVQVEPLQHGDAVYLFNLLVERLGLDHLDLQDFRPRALDAAGGNPGQIIEMCKLAADPRYWSGRHIKFAPLRIDAYARLLA